MRRLLLTYVTVLNLIIDTHSACLVYAFLLNLVKSYFLSGAHSNNVDLSLQNVVAAVSSLYIFHDVRTYETTPKSDPITVCL